MVPYQPSYDEVVATLKEVQKILEAAREEIHKKGLVVELQQRQIEALLSTLWLIKPKLPSADQHIIDHLLDTAKANVGKDTNS